MPKMQRAAALSTAAAIWQRGNLVQSCGGRDGAQRPCARSGAQSRADERRTDNPGATPPMAGPIDPSLIYELG